MLGLLGMLAVALPVSLTGPGRLAGSAPSGSAPSGSARSGSAQSGSQALGRVERLPLQAQGVISTTIAAGESAFAARRTAAGYRLAGGGLLASLRRGGVRLSSDGGSLSLALARVGRGGRERSVGAVSPIARANRVAFNRAGVAEWYAAGPLGIEQGFTVARRPVGSRGPLTLVLRVGGSLVARRSGSGLVFVSGSGRVALRYGGLAAVDASGRSLPASLALERGRLLLRIGDRGARYPLRVDPFIEQQKIVPTDETGNGAGFGNSVALSSDGSTALIGGYSDNGQVGAAWVYTRSGSTWSEQRKIVPADAISGNPPPTEFGGSVALSSDGNTALIGGSGDAGLVGAAWVYTRSGSTWSEQQKIVPSDETGLSDFGSGVALSSDGNTALIGGYNDGPPNGGAAWVYTRSGGAWSERTKIVPTDETPIISDPDSSEFGWSVALSSDGGTALIGGPMDGASGNTGAAWIYTGSGGSWSEKQKIVPPDEIGGASGFGSAVALSPDGSTALIGGSGDNSSAGAAWVYVNSGGSWSEQHKIVPTDEIANASFGSSVALSSNGSTALIGGDGDGDNGFEGAAWVYSRSGSSWSEQRKIVASDETGGTSSFGSGAALSPDASTALIGGDTDNVSVGAAWVFTASTTSQTYTLSASVAGTGKGTVTGSSISCPGTCTRAYNAGTAVALTAAPASGSKFSGWSGACTGTAACKVTMNSDLDVTASFGLASTASLARPTGSKITKAKINAKQHTASFNFTAKRATGFKCALNPPTKKGHRKPKLKFSSCKSPRSYKHLKAGKYTFLVQGVNSAGADKHRASKTFKID